MSNRKQRLDPENYAVPGSVWHITIGTDRRRRLLVSTDLISVVVDALWFQCEKRGADLLVYCLMPDHVHVVVTMGRGDLVGFVRDVKSWSTRHYQRTTGQRVLWQTSFYDHGVRKTEKMDDLVAYVLNNPVRKGMVDEWDAYPWSGGSLVEEPPET